jgi:hypothetical protein
VRSRRGCVALAPACNGSVGHVPQSSTGRRCQKYGHLLWLSRIFVRCEERARSSAPHGSVADPARIGGTALGRKSLQLSSKLRGGKITDRESSFSHSKYRSSPALPRFIRRYPIKDNALCETRSVRSRRGCVALAPASSGSVGHVPQSLTGRRCQKYGHLLWL